MMKEYETEKPCPFCAYPRTHFVSADCEGHTEYRVECLNCGAQGPNERTQPGSIEMWNLRRTKFPELMWRTPAVEEEV